jgi:hypothetical protein
MTTKRGSKAGVKGRGNRARTAPRAGAAKAARGRKTSTKSSKASTKRGAAKKGSAKKGAAKKGAAKKGAVGKGAPSSTAAAAPLTTARTTVSAAHFELIVKRIQDRACVPFLGAAANVKSDALRYKGLPLGTDVARALITKVHAFTGRDLLNLARISLEYEFEVDRQFLVDELLKILPDQSCTPSPLLKTLARLPFKTVITTNYDRLLEKALADKGVPFKTLVQPRSGWDTTAEVIKGFNDLDVYKGTVVYKIHGSFDVEPGQQPPPSVIITEDDYIDFLTVLGREKEKIGIPNFVIKRITGSTLLFLGYSLEDWDFRTIYKGWIETLPPHQSRKSFAFQRDPPGFWVDFWQRKGVIIYNVDLYDFSQQLYDKYRATYG